ncbi:hypothetical protein RIU96_05655 [Corynebacterium sp. Z-1]|uniref:hypothetical protein n=1 Tax=Corynebacterium sp. Z-1 TaxID=3074378 RepID=UPI00288309B8|nr:hypothetical protein [Corynebacterium sp. Z-1]WNI13893.1 hypothetical protein RIU96_05655 [Corynebacterium sp. Z-1]
MIGVSFSETPPANIHQVAKWQTTIDGVVCDINDVYTADWGQWTPGQAAAPVVQLPNIPIEQLLQSSSEMSSQGNAALQQALDQARAFLP